MNLQHLRYIIEVENCGSVTKAAQNLYMGQPNLSKLIKEMEQEVGISIFSRTTKGVVPTRNGKAFLSYARKLVSQADELQSLFKKPNESHIHFNVTVPRATYCSLAFTNFINKLGDTEKIKVYFREADAISAIADVSSGDADLAVIRYQDIYDDYFSNITGEKNLEINPLFTFNMRLMMSEKNPLAKYSDVPYHLLSDCIEITHGDYNNNGVSFSRINRDTQIEAPTKTIYIYDRGSQLNLLQRVDKAFMWVSPIPADFLAENHLITRPCSLSSELNKDVIIYRKGKTLAAHEQLFIDTLKEDIAEMTS